ncbi:MAG TPA: hypothetical protein DCY20_08500 [Firmicutes bacterium]|nr:hypothetical protein [Bacillota bacterium]
MLEEIVQQIVNDYAQLEEVEAITLAGSIAANRNDAISDIDLDLFLNKPIPVEKRLAIAKKYADKMEIDNQYFGSGDEYFLRDYPIEIDVCLFDWEDILKGLDNVMNDYVANVGYTTCFVHNVTHAKVLFDRHGGFEKAQTQYGNHYPTELKQNIMKMNYPLLRTCYSSYYNQIEKAIKREDYNSVQHRVTAFLASYFDIIFAINEMLHPGEKRLISIIKTNCGIYPKHIEENVNQLIGNYSSEILTVIQNMVDELDAILKEENLI